MVISATIRRARKAHRCEALVVPECRGCIQPGERFLVVVAAASCPDAPKSREVCLSCADAWARTDRTVREALLALGDPQVTRKYPVSTEENPGTSAAPPVVPGGDFTPSRDGSIRYRVSTLTRQEPDS